MKPIIIFKEKNNDGTMSFTQEEIEKLLTDAYNQGYADGLSKGTNHPIWLDKDKITIPTSPSIPSTPFPYNPIVCDTDRNTISTSKDINVSLS